MSRAYLLVGIVSRVHKCTKGKGKPNDVLKILACYFDLNTDSLMTMH